MPSNSMKPPSLSIRWKIPLLVVTPLITAVSLTGWLAFRNGYKAVDELAKQLSSTISKEIDKTAQSYLNKPLLLNQVNASAIESGNLSVENLQDLERYFWYQVKQPNLATYLYFGNDRGEFVGVERRNDGKRFAKIKNPATSPDLISYDLKSPGNRTNAKSVFKGYDPRNRDWYKAAKEAGEPTWTKIYPFASHPVPGITAATPIFDNAGKVQGVLGVDVSLQQINDFLSSLKISKSGKALILARSGKLVGSSIPGTRFVGSDNKLIDATDNIQPVILQRTVQHLREEFGSLDKIDGKQPLSSFQFDGEAQLVNVSVFKNGHGVNWLIVVVIPESDFLGDFYRSAMFTLFLGLGITGGAAILGLIAARQISEPIFAMTDAAASIEAENFDDKSLDLVTKRGDELGQLARVFQHMTIQVYSREQQLKQHVQKLDKEIGQFKKERQAAESNEKNYLLGLLQKSRSLRTKAKNPVR